MGRPARRGGGTVITPLTLINTTQHPITILRDGPIATVIPTSEVSVRIAEKHSTTVQVDTNFGDLPIECVSYTDLIGLPDEQDGVGYILSLPAALVARLTDPARRDLFVPGNQVRDEHGTVIGAEGLYRV